MPVRKGPGRTMSDSTYVGSDIRFLGNTAGTRRLRIWLQGEVKTPPFIAVARLEAGLLLPKLQRGDQSGLPHLRPMPVVGARCEELRISDATSAWRILYHLDVDVIVIAAVLAKKTPATPAAILATAKARFRQYDRVITGAE